MASALVASFTSCVAPAVAIEPDSSRMTATFIPWQAAASTSLGPGTFVVRASCCVASGLPEHESLLKSSTLSADVPPGGGGNTCSPGPTLSGSGNVPSLSSEFLSNSYSRVTVRLPALWFAWSTQRGTPPMVQRVDLQVVSVTVAAIRMSYPAPMGPVVMGVDPARACRLVMEIAGAAQATAARIPAARITTRTATSGFHLSRTNPFPKRSGGGRSPLLSGTSDSTPRLGGFKAGERPLNPRSLSSRRSL